MIETNKVYEMDAFELLKQLPDESVDMILCDLPYGTTACKWDEIIPLKELWKEYNRIIKKDKAIVLTASQPFTSKLIISNIENFRYEIIWDKKIPSNFQLMNFQFGKIHENILVFSKSPAVFCNGKNMIYYPQKTKREKERINKKVNFKEDCVTLRKGHSLKNMGEKIYSKRLPTSIIQYSNANRKNKFHPTQKPIDLFKYLIKTFTKEGDLVIDNCVGGGTTAVACKQLGRNFICCDNNAEYVAIANKRLVQQSVADFTSATPTLAEPKEFNNDLEATPTASPKLKSEILTSLNPNILSAIPNSPLNAWSNST